MSDVREKVDLIELRRQAELLVRLLGDETESSGRNNSINTVLIRILELVLSKEEVEALKLLGGNPELLTFLMKNKDILKKVRKVGAVLRVQEG